jgi:hypothetical protein
LLPEDFGLQIPFHVLALLDAHMLSGTKNAQSVNPCLILLLCKSLVDVTVKVPFEFPKNFGVLPVPHSTSFLKQSVHHSICISMKRR